MNGKQLKQIAEIQSHLEEASDHLMAAMQENTWGQVPDALVHKSVETVVNTLAQLQAYEREHFPDAKIVGLDFPTGRGIQFERIYAEMPF